MDVEKANRRICLVSYVRKFQKTLSKYVFLHIYHLCGDTANVRNYCTEKYTFSVYDFAVFVGKFVF